MNTIIEVKNLSFGYNTNSILENISLSVNSADFVAIAGPNGAGKTTLLNLLCRILSAKTGIIEIDKKDINSYSHKNLAKKIAVVRQEFVPAFDFSVIETVTMGRTPYLDTFGFENKEDKDIVSNALEVTDTAQFASRPIGELSGGERQRVFIARALAQDTPILLLDEPTSFLDLKHQVDTYDLLKKMQAENRKTIVIITHDINLASQYADYTLLLGTNHGYLFGKSRDILSPENIEKLFNVKIFTANVLKEKFFFPLGKLAKDSTP